MTRSFELQGELLILRGNTYEIKDTIRQLGGRWNPALKVWQLSHKPEVVELLIELGFSGAIRHEPQELPTVSVQQFVQLTAELIQTRFQQMFWLEGEVSNLKATNSHRFFDLIDPECEKGTKVYSVSAVLWSGRYQSLKEKYGELPLENGLKIRVLVHVEFRSEGSRLSIVVNDIDLKHAQGLLALSREKIITELKRRNLFDLNRGTSLPAFPFSIALITSFHSRASEDFIHELSLSELPFKIDVYDCHMQGGSTEKDICRAFQQIANSSLAPDCVVLTRGGGSKMDLRWFDNLEICKAIAYCKQPVLTAIGHTDDVSVADLVAFKAEKTPTGAARYLTERAQRSSKAIDDLLATMGTLVRRRLAKEAQKLQSIEERIPETVRQRVQREHEKLEKSARQLRLIEKVAALPLERGFFQLVNEEGKTLTPAQLLHTPLPVHVRLHGKSASKRVAFDATITSAQVEE